MGSCGIGLAAQLAAACVAVLPALVRGAPALEPLGPAPAPVLVLHSYHPTFTWTDLEQQGIRAGFEARQARVELQVEYLDAKRHPGPEVAARMEELLRVKMGATAPRVVLATDNAALEFALEVRPRLFPRAAVVFCGLNGPPEAVIRGRPGVTGVLERWDPAGTLRAVARMQPKVRDVLVVHDQTPSGLGTRVDLEAVAPEFADRFRFHFLPLEPLGATLQRLAALPDGWVVLLMGYNQDADGKILDSAETGPLLARRARVPVYTMDETRFGGGVVGGSLLAGAKQGEVAAELASLILEGISPDALPLVRDPVAALRFDALALQRYGIPTVALPTGSAVVNVPTSFYQRHRLRIWALAVFVLALVALSAALSVSALVRNRAEAALRDSEESLRITLDSIGDAVIATDARGAVVRMNPTAEKLTGWSLRDARGRSLEEVFHVVASADGDRVESPVARALREGRAVAMTERTCVLHARGGARRSIADSAAPIRDLGGAVVGGVLVFRDITEELDLQAQLRQAQRMELIGQLAGGVAHDFNNILTALLGTAQVLSERLAEGTEERELADELMVAAGRATELTRQLLAFSRKGQLQRTVVQAHRLVKEVVGLLSRSIDKGIAIRTDLRAQPDTLPGDPALLQSALLNLAVNGRDAMPRGGTLTFATELVSAAGGPGDLEPGEYLQLSVSDTGVGMSAAVQERLFEPYFTTKPLGQGTGLGLASVYGCVKSHKGHIQVHSAPGQGSCFKLLLPLTRVGVPAAAGEPGGVIRGQGRVVVVDDEEIVRNAVAKMLRSLGYQVETFGDGHDAVNHLRGHPGEVDLVVLDLIMPRIGGRDVFYLLRAIDPTLPVVIASGFTQHEITDELLRAGASGFLNKPFRLEDLSRQAHAALATRRRAAGS